MVRYSTRYVSIYRSGIIIALTPTADVLEGINTH